MTHLLATAALLVGTGNPLPEMPKRDDYGVCWLYPSRNAFGEATVSMCVWWQYFGFFWNGENVSW